MSKIALDWAERLGYKSSVEYYEFLAVAIMVEAYGVDETAKKINKTKAYVEARVEAHQIASMPYMRMDKADYIKVLKKIFESMLNDKEAQKERALIILSERLDVPVMALEELLK